MSAPAKPKPKCLKIYSWTDRKEARTELLRQWARGDYRCNGTHWCGQHAAFHLTSHAKSNGKNYLYRD